MIKPEKIRTAGHGSRSAEQGFMSEFTMTAEEASKLIESLESRIREHPTGQVRMIVREDRVFAG